MNIKARIEKLKKQAIQSESSFCDCFDIHFRRMIDKVYDGAPYDETEASLPDGDYCHKCKKPVSLRTQNFNRSLEMIYG